MRRLAASFAAAALLLTGCTGDPEPADQSGTAETSAKQVSTLPELTLPGLTSSGDTELSSLKGPLVVNLFASWCTPCRTELPLYQKFYDEHGQQVDVVGIDYQDPQRDRALKLVEDSGVTFPTLVDEGGDLNAASPFPVIRGLPFVALVDADGTVVHQEFVVIESQDQLEQLVEEHLGVTL